MIINGAMNASAQTLERFGADVLAHTGQIEAALALGAPPPESVGTYTRSAVSASLIPSLNSMRSLGIVWIPGLMAGMLLTGRSRVYIRAAGGSCDQGCQARFLWHTEFGARFDDDLHSGVPCYH